jgi:hypothetical protein
VAGVDDSDVEVLGEDQHAGVRVGSADADAVQASGDAQSDDAGLLRRWRSSPGVTVTARTVKRRELSGRGRGPLLSLEHMGEPAGRPRITHRRIHGHVKRFQGQEAAANVVIGVAGLDRC